MSLVGRMMRLFVFPLVSLVLALSGSVAFAKMDPEFRIGLTEKGMRRLLPKFSKASKSRHDIYFDILCDGEFISEKQSEPFKLRIKEKAKGTALQYSTLEEKVFLQQLGTPISYRIAESEEAEMDPSDELQKLSERFLKMIKDTKAPPARLLSLASEIHELYRGGPYLASRDLEPFLADPDCLFLPSGENTKTRHSLSFEASDGIELDVKVGVTIELDGSGKKVSLYELEADPVQVSRARDLDRERVAYELIDFLTEGRGLREDEVSDSSSTVGAYVQARMREAMRWPASSVGAATDTGDSCHIPDTESTIDYRLKK